MRCLLIGCTVISALLAVNFNAAQAQMRVVPESMAQLQLSYSPIVKRVSPAVVNIYTARKVTTSSPVSPLMRDPFFRQFLGPQMKMLGRPQQRTVSSLGSGVIVSPKGELVSSLHVIKGADEIRVQLTDEREFAAKIVKTDELADLAILQLQEVKDDLPYLSLGDSGALEVGDIVLAVGNPFGVGQTVTSGIVSATARNASQVSKFQQFIQTDAAINPGNSGGALVNLAGELVGINTAIYSPSGGSNGIGFAIPETQLRALKKREPGKQAFGGVTLAGKHPLNGVTVAQITPELVDTLKLQVDKGVVVIDSDQKRGIATGDVILQLQNKPIATVADCEAVIAASRGPAWKLSFMRGKKLNTLLLQP